MSYKKTGGAHVYEVEEGYDVYAPFYDKCLGHLDSFEGYDLFSLMGDIKGLRILDVGGGTGRIVKEMVDRGAEVVCCDISGEMLKIFKKKFSGVECVKADIREMPFEDESFDLVVATFVIVHLKKLMPAFDEVYRVLKKGGSFVVTNINQKKAPKLKTFDEKFVIKSHYHRPETVISELEEAFFEVEKEEFVEYQGAWINQIVRARK
ncbi:class I SAM-dependent methyltransferase [Candidatus Gracilibacteria bacterium]|nr:class I SAM-dependent methyltransferase [Candidatus Gracilibacteria bacterium]